jgi:hypothetical protein
MSCAAKLVNATGLALGMIGVVVIFKWGPPQPSFEGDSMLLESTDTKKLVAERKTYERLSRVGLALIGFGFAFQLCAVWL